MPAFVRSMTVVPLAMMLAAIPHQARAQEKSDKPRFIERAKYVEDTQSGLLWQKDGNESGKKNFQQAAEYAKKLKLGGLTGWRVPTRAELAAIFPAIDKPFIDTMYTEQECCDGPHKTDTYSYWTSEWDNEARDYAWVYQWYAGGGANNCFASKNFAYVRCVRDPVVKKE